MLPQQSVCHTASHLSLQLLHACEVAMSSFQLMLKSLPLPFAGPDENRVLHHRLCERRDPRTSARVSHPWRPAVYARDYQRYQQRQDPGLQLGGGGQRPSVSTQCTWIKTYRLWKFHTTAGLVCTLRHATCWGGIRVRSRMTKLKNPG